MDVNHVEDYVTGGMSSTKGDTSTGQRCQFVDSISDWRSCGQVDNGTPSTSPAFWDTDDDDCGPRPSELYGKFTWKIKNFSQVNKRELRSDAFEVGCYKWYILIYPQGCDVCNHLSLFLCVSNHEKLLPGWSHFAQFTIAVVNKDRKRNKCSDTLHRFWKKEHDWGWKKFMELSKVLDGFLTNDTLVIKAKVQVIREKAHRPFRCLDYQYRKKLVRSYFSNVEQICRRFLEDRKNKLSKLIEDEMRWSSFCAFWLGIDQNSRQHMARDKSDTILRVVVKHFFIEKEVTSTLVMDSLHSGLRALECQSKNKKGKLAVEMEEVPSPLVLVDIDMFVLADDVLLLLERVANEPLPTIPSPPKDDKVSQNRTKEGCSSDESIEHDERRLTELGRRTVEMFALAHIFSRIEVAYQEAVALKRQEELIREEEEAWQAENELKAKRNTAEKDKRSKKKQTKQKRNNQKNKEKQRELKYDSLLVDNKQEENRLADIASAEFSGSKGSVINGVNTPEVAFDVSYNGGDVAEIFHPIVGDRNFSLLNWEMDSSAVHLSIDTSSSKMSNDQLEKNCTVMDDSSSTCSTDSVSSVLPNGHCNGYPVFINNSETSPNEVRKPDDKNSKSYPSVASNRDKAQYSLISTHLELEADAVSPERFIIGDSLVEKQEATASSHKKTIKEQRNAEKPPSSSPSPVKKPPPFSQPPKHSSRTTSTLINPPTPLTFPKRPAALPAKNVNAQTPPPRSNPPAVSTVPPPPPLLSRSPGRLATDPSPSHPPQSYRNAIIGRTTTTTHSVPSSSTLPPPSSIVKTEALCSQQQPAGTTGGVAEEFPHIDIINDLLNEEHGVLGRAAAGVSGPYYAGHPHHHFLRRQYSLPGASDELYYRMQNGHFTRPPYANGHHMQNQWLYGHHDLSNMNVGNAYQNLPYPRGWNHHL